MPAQDAVIGAVVGAVLGSALTIGYNVWHSYKFDQPALEQAQKAAANEEAARKRAEAREAQKNDQLVALQKQSDEVKRQFAIAKDQFISHITDAVNEGVSRIPGSEPGRPVPPDVVARTTNTRARRIVDERDRARSAIQSLTTNLTQISDELDSDIDDLKHVIDTQPVDQKQVDTLLRKVADKWPTKMTLLEQIAQNSLRQIGCPLQFVSNP
jgi:spore cortex formation protein SpoVR/YcgB (stage V sporulation)